MSVNYRWFDFPPAANGRTLCVFGARGGGAFVGEAVR